jgi:hypothetical protein
MLSILIGLGLFTTPSFADEDKKPKVEKPKKGKEEKEDKDEKKKVKLPKAEKKVKTKKSNDVQLNTISPNDVKSPKQTHTTSTPQKNGSRTTPSKEGQNGRRTPTINPSNKTSTSTRKRRRRTSTSGSSTSTSTAAAGIATAAVGMAALALIPTKSKSIKCPFDKVRVGLRGGSQLSRPDEGAFGGGLAIGYRWCNPFAVDLSYVHYGNFEANANSPAQASIQTFLFSSILSPYVSLGGSVSYEGEELLYGPHGGLGAQILIKNGKSIAAIQLEGRYTQYLNEGELPQESQFQGILGVDFYF